MFSPLLDLYSLRVMGFVPMSDLTAEKFYKFLTLDCACLFNNLQ